MCVCACTIGWQCWYGSASTDLNSRGLLEHFSLIISPSPSSRDLLLCLGFGTAQPHQLQNAERAMCQSSLEPG